MCLTKTLQKYAGAKYVTFTMMVVGRGGYKLEHKKSDYFFPDLKRKEKCSSLVYFFCHPLLH